MRKINLKKLSKFVPIIGIILFIYIIYDIGIQKILNAFLLIPVYLYILAALPFILTLILGAYKWQYISKKQKINLSHFYFMKLYLINAFYVTIVPAGLGGYVKIFYLKKKSNATIEKCIVNTLIDVITGSIIGFSIALIGSIYFIKYFPGFFPIMLIFLIFNLTAFFVFMHKSGGKRFFKYIIRPLIPKNYKERIERSFESLYEDIPKYKDTIVLFLIELIIWTIVAVQVYIIATAFTSFNIPFHEFLLIHTISIVSVIILPISIGGLGVREGVFVILLQFYNIAPDIAVVISLSGYIVKMIIPSIIGMILTIKKEPDIEGIRSELDG